MSASPIKWPMLQAMRLFDWLPSDLRDEAERCNAAITSLDKERLALEREFAALDPADPLSVPSDFAAKAAAAQEHLLDLLKRELAERNAVEDLQARIGTARHEAELQALKRVSEARQRAEAKLAKAGWHGAVEGAKTHLETRGVVGGVIAMHPDVVSEAGAVEALRTVRPHLSEYRAANRRAAQEVAGAIRRIVRGEVAVDLAPAGNAASQAIQAARRDEQAFQQARAEARADLV